MRHQPAPPVVRAENWSETEAFRWGLRLFDAGYYWEAHEAWESVWNSLPRHSSEAAFVQGLIKLAASGVKCLEGNRAGAVRHARRAEELLLQSTATAGAAESPTAPSNAKFPFSAQPLLKAIDGIAENPPVLHEPSDGTPRSILGIILGQPPCLPEDPTTSSVRESPPGPPEASD